MLSYIHQDGCNRSCHMVDLQLNDDSCIKVESSLLTSTSDRMTFTQESEWDVVSQIRIASARRKIDMGAIHSADSPC